MKPIVVGLDPGYVKTGLVCLQGDFYVPEIRNHKTIKLAGTYDERARELTKQLEEYLTEHAPLLVVIEWPGDYLRVGKHRNTKSIMKLRMAVEWIRCVIIDMKLEKKSIWPDVSKKATRLMIARKHVAQEKCKQLWPDVKLNEHEADAAMLALHGLRTL